MTAIRAGDSGTAALRYQPGFGNEFASEAVPGALPIGQNSPQHPPLGLYSELVSGSTFSAPRSLNRRSYLFRIRPSVVTKDFFEMDAGDFRTPPLDVGPSPGPIRWGPAPMPTKPCDFIEGLFTICGNGSPLDQSGMAVHAYGANKAMSGKAFCNADGEFLMIPQSGGVRIVTELGVIEATPGDAVLLPRGLKFRVDPTQEAVRGFVCENYGHPFILPELGLIGSHGLANAIDFVSPVAAFDDEDEPTRLIFKQAGRIWGVDLDHSPFDVVAWRGNWAPSKFDMNRFVVMGTLTVDHPDPSIFCALTSPSHRVGGPNVDFMVLPPRWVVSEHTMRPPGFHRNSVAEFVALIKGRHDSRAADFRPGSTTLQNSWSAHGPDLTTYDAGLVDTLEPRKMDGGLSCMFETRFPFELTGAALAAEHRQHRCAEAWSGFERRFPGLRTEAAEKADQ